MFIQRLAELVMIMKLLLIGIYFIVTYLSFSIHFDNIRIAVRSIAYICTHSFFSFFLKQQRNI